MTADEARDRAGYARADLSRAVRALSVPATDWPAARDALGRAALRCMELARDCGNETVRGGGEMDCVTVPPVRPFAGLRLDKALALKPLEEAAEAFAAWQSTRLPEDGRRAEIVDECCDVIQAAVNLAAAAGATDLTEAMRRCEARNRERGRYE